MKRFHAHVRVDDLESSVRFYSTLFGTEPAVLKADYAKWMLDDPRVNFAITAGSTATGLDHLGLQVESDEDLATIAATSRRRRAVGREAGERRMLLCARQQRLGVRSERHIVGDVSHLRREHRLRQRCRAAVPSHRKRRKLSSCCTPAPSSTSACCGAAKAQ